MRYFFLLIALSIQAIAQNSGSLIVLDVKGEAETFLPNGQLIQNKLTRGMIMSEGISLETSQFSEVLILFSNGTTLTLEENSKLVILKFKQEPFLADNVNLEDSEIEPSSSQLELSLQFGSFVSQTKTLSKLSSYIINTPSGLVRVKGTQFQLGVDKTGALKLDVSESIVSITPPGQTKSIPVSKGGGLDINPTGKVSERLINPLANAKITSKTSKARVASGKIPISTLSLANSKANSLAVKVASKNFSASSQVAQSSPNLVEKKESTAPSTKQKSLDNQIKQSESLSSNKPLPSASEKDLNILKVTEPSEFIGKLLEFVPTEDATSIIKDIPNFDQILEAEYPEYQETIDNILSDNNDPDEGNQDPSGDDDGDVGDLTPPDSEVPTDPPSVTPTPPAKHYLVSISSDGKLLIDILDYFENSLHTEETSGKDLTEINSFLAEWFPGEDQVSDAERFSLSALNDYLDNTPNLPEGFDATASLRRSINITSLVLNDFELFDTDLTDLDFADFADSGEYTSGQVIDVGQLVDIYKNDKYLENLTKVAIQNGAFGGNGESPQAAIAETLLNSVDGIAGLPDFISLVDPNLQITNLLGSEKKSFEDFSDDHKEELKALTTIYLNNISGIVGGDITLGKWGQATSLNVGKWLTKASDPNDKKLFAIVAAKDLRMWGSELTFNNSVDGLVNTAEDHALVLGATDHVEIQKGAKINFEGSNLGIGAYSSLTLDEVSIDTGGNLAIGSLNELEIKSTSDPSEDKFTTFKVGRYSDRDNVYLYAEDKLTATRLKFDGGRTREIYMEANTIDLREVHFPNDSQVILRSKEGMPHFYGGIYENESTSWAPYKVNFFSDSNTYAEQPILKGEFVENGTNGYNSTNFKTGAKEPAIKIRPFPAN
jgi:hypothetical protein